MRKHLSIAIMLITLSSINAKGQTLADSIYQQNQKILKILESSSISTQIFLGFRYFEEGGNNYNEFTVKRGYINFQKSLNKHLSGRITPDLTVDKEGDGKGDLEMRLKYCYMELKDDGNYWIFSNPSVVVGEVFTPWISFEEKINKYRVVGSHFLDKSTIVSSADFGITATTLIGGKLDKAYLKEVSSAYPGKYGSVAFGVYNGGGYHAVEENNNKTIQWRLTLRPFPEIITGLQLSYSGVQGKGNTDLYPNWKFNSGAVTYENRHFTITGQYFKGVGNHEGDLADTLGNSYKADGYSAFAEVKLLNKKLSVFGRYDLMNTKMIDKTAESTQEIVGIAYHIYGKNKVVVDYNRNKKSGKTIGIIELMVELAL
ncbi:MAG: hypothetical protein H6536_06585 [Bacteroidales bacterium]|nr:hypothetical protein [Bacteroidales bacterium]